MAEAASGGGCLSLRLRESKNILALKINGSVFSERFPETVRITFHIYKYSLVKRTG
jgi:hypothetical protein